MKDLSVIVPVYNISIKTLKRCIDSIIELKDITYEILLINDGSSEEYCKEYELLLKYYKNIEIIYIYKKNGGVSSARNLGIKKATGRYVTFVDSDDMLYSGAFQTKDLNMGIDVIQYNKIHIFNNHEMEIRELNEAKGYVNNSKLLKAFISKDSLYSPCGKIILRSFLEENGISFQEYMINGEDAVFNLDLLLHHPSFFYMDEIAYIYYMSFDNEKNRLRNRPKEILENFYIIYTKKKMVIENNDINLEKKMLSEILANKSINDVFRLCMSYSLDTRDFVKFQDLVIQYLKKVDITNVALNKKSKFQYFLMDGKHWIIVTMIAYVREFYLRYLKKHW